MANSIALASKYIPILDEVYKNASLTSDLDGAPELSRPARGAWIEIKAERRYAEAIRSRPARGAWIEI